MVGFEGQVRTPEQVVVAVGRARVGELRAVDGDAPPGQPAQQAEHYGQVGFLGGAAGEPVWLAIVQADDRLLAAYA